MCHFAPPVMDSAATHPFSIGSWHDGQIRVSSKFSPSWEAIGPFSSYRPAAMGKEGSHFNIHTYYDPGERPKGAIRFPGPNIPVTLGNSME